MGANLSVAKLVNATYSFDATATAAAGDGDERALNELER